jgi:hypothetical protein
MKQRLPALVFAAVYVLVLATQLPHIWSAYASLEDASIPFAQVTAWGAAVAFELSIGVFTYRIVKGSRRRWTRRGLLFFIVASIVANAYYYQVWPFVFDFVMRVFATVALPLALALFAEEFGALERLVEQRAKRAERKVEQPEQRSEQPTYHWECPEPRCDFVATSRHQRAGHGNAHRTKGEGHEHPARN